MWGIGYWKEHRNYFLNILHGILCFVLFRRTIYHRYFFCLSGENSVPKDLDLAGRSYIAVEFRRSQTLGEAPERKLDLIGFLDTMKLVGFFFSIVSSRSQWSPISPITVRLFLFGTIASRSRIKSAKGA